MPVLSDIFCNIVFLIAWTLIIKTQDARQQFRVTLTESSYKLNEAAKRCGKAVKKAKAYHEARIKAQKAQEKVQEAAHTYQRAVGMFQAAKETITIAEETSMQGRKKRDFDSALQEMLNHATLEVGCCPGPNGGPTVEKCGDPTKTPSLPPSRISLKPFHIKGVWNNFVSPPFFYWDSNFWTQMWIRS